MTPIVAAVPDAISLLKHINSSYGTLYAALDLANDFVSKLVHNTHQKQFAIVLQGHKYTFISYLCGMSALQPVS
jgi:hypothetical protein